MMLQLLLMSIVSAYSWTSSSLNVHWSSLKKRLDGHFLRFYETSLVSLSSVKSNRARREISFFDVKPWYPIIITTTFENQPIVNLGKCNISFVLGISISMYWFFAISELRRYFYCYCNTTFFWFFRACSFLFFGTSRVVFWCRRHSSVVIFSSCHSFALAYCHAALPAASTSTASTQCARCY